MDEAILGIMVPMVLFVCLLLAFWVQRLFRHRSEREVQLTLRAAIERDQPLSPETIESMIPKPNPDADMRRGVIFIVVGVAISAFALSLGEEEAIGPVVGLASFPLLIGIAYLLLWRFSKRANAG